jgi:chromate transporter
VLTLFVFYADFAANSPLLRAIVTGVGAAGAGMFIGTAIKLGRPIAKQPLVLAIIAACFLCVAVMRISLIVVLPVALGISLLLARRGKL